MNSGAVIALHKVAKSFGKRRVLNDINLHVPQGSVFGFLGNNGAGKSTTIRLITGLLHADAGDVIVLNRDVRRQRIDILRDIGCIVDAPTLYPNLTANEFLQIGCAIKRLPRGEIDRVLDLVQLTGAAQKRVGHFSLGMKQRLALAHALLGKPSLLVLDEPSNGLDPYGIREIRTLLHGLPESTNCTVFLSSHQLDEVEKVATHVALLQDGMIASQGPIASLISRDTGVLAIEAADAGLAAEVLRASRYDARKTGDNLLEVHRIAHENAEHVNAMLIHAGISLFQSVYRRPTLEQWFMRSTTTSAQKE
jgi:ABC-type multidrug transport system ATPase subunit